MPDLFHQQPRDYTAPSNQPFWPPVFDICSSFSDPTWVTHQSVVCSAGMLCENVRGGRDCCCCLLRASTELSSTAELVERLRWFSARCGFVCLLLVFPRPQQRLPNLSSAAVVSTPRLYTVYGGLVTLHPLKYTHPLFTRGASDNILSVLAAFINLSSGLSG